MSVTSGFFNSLNGDRKYNAQQMSAIFDGIINDGVFASIGTCFGVRANTDTTITVGVGRAWFNSAWVYNDALLPLTYEVSEMILNRYDAVVIEIDHSDPGRKGDIKIIKGTPASAAEKPKMTHTDQINQYPLAYIYRAAGTTVVNQSDIQSVIGTSECPYITGILQVTNIDNIVAQWEGEWEVWSGQWTQWEALWDKWFADQSADVDAETSAWLSQMQSEFDTWFNGLQLILDGDVAANLANSVLELQERFRILAEEMAVYEEIEDSSEDILRDSDGNPIEGRTVIGGSAESSGELPTHAARHAKNGDDPLTPAMIGAATPPKIRAVSLSQTGWGDNTQSVSVPGVSENELAQKITVAPASASGAAYRAAGVVCTAQSEGRLTFTADKAPTANLTVYITIEEVIPA